MVWWEFNILALHNRKKEKTINKNTKITHHSKHNLTTVKHGGDSIMLCGCFSLVKVKNKIDDSVYQTILKKKKKKENIFQSTRNIRQTKRFTFQPDNDPRHTVRATLKWFKTKKLNVSELCNQSSRPQSNCEALKIAGHPQSLSSLTEKLLQGSQNMKKY